jgi:hypothetical protein
MAGTLAALMHLLSSHPANTMSDVSVVLVGCGVPLKSMGWYHATQILHKDSNM